MFKQGVMVKTTVPPRGVTMKTIGKLLFVPLSVLLLVLAACEQRGALAAGWSTADLAAALDNPSRPEADKERDAGRMPAEVVTFVGIEPGMRVLDVLASGGWYTEVLSVAVGSDGAVYTQNPQSYLESRGGANGRALNERLAKDHLTNVVRMDVELGELTIEPGSVDAAITALNFHDTYNFSGPEAAAAFMQAIYAVLKPGGALGMIDHAGNADENNVKLHRIPKQVVVDIATDAGFVLEAESDVLAHSEDNRTQMVFRLTRGKTDRFLLKLRKPG